MSKDRVFKNRAEAGRLLAQKLHDDYRHDNPIVIALPRGGVPVGVEVARELEAPLDIVIVRKLGAPGNAEYGIGAMAEDGTYWINSDAAEATGAVGATLQELVSRERQEIKRRVRALRQGRPHAPVEGRTVILVDDGLATGVSAIAAARYLKQAGARKIVLAVPVCAAESARLLQAEVSEVVCLSTPSPFYAVGEWYRDFTQLSDDEVIQSLNSATPFSGSDIQMSANGVRLMGDLVVPPDARGLVLFAHGSGSSRKSTRNIQVARGLNGRGFATLLFDLLTEDESRFRGNVFDIALLAERLKHVTQWARTNENLRQLALGYFGASTGAAAALLAAAELGTEIEAVVSRGGRPDLTGPALSLVASPVLLIVGGDDHPVLELNREALRYLVSARLEVVPGATHLFEEEGALERVAELAGNWFEKHMRKKASDAAA